MQILDSENGIYQWVYEMATSITDVTKDHKDDLTKYNVTLPSGKTADETDAGYVFEIKLNPDAKWQDGTAITADTYVYSMQQLLDSSMKTIELTSTTAVSPQLQVVLHTIIQSLRSTTLWFRLTATERLLITLMI